MGLIDNIENYFVDRYISKNSITSDIQRRNAITVKTDTAAEIYETYKQYPIIFSIVNDIYKAIKNTPIWISDSEGKRIVNTETNKYLSKIKQPNVYSSTESNFAADCAMELVTFGRCFVVRKDYVSSNSQSYFIIRNTDIIRIEYKQPAFSERVVSKVYYYRILNGERIEDSVSTNLFELEYSKVDKRDTSLYTQNYICPIVASRKVLEAHANMIDAVEANYSDGGARKIISFKNGDGSYSYEKTILPEAETDLHDKLKDKYGRNTTDRKYILTKQEVSVNDLAVPTAQLDMVSSKPAFETSICNAFNYPPQLLGIKAGVYKSQTEAERAFYIRCVAPLANYVLSQLNYIFGTNIDGKIELDYSEYDFFQEGKQKKGTAVLTFMQGATQALEASVITKEQVDTELKNIL